MIRLLFVYGSLQRCGSGAAAQALHRNSKFLCAARVRGSLYRVSWYPGMVADSDDWVRGELFELSDPEAALRMLDEYEGEEFERALVEAEADGQSHACAAWAYLYRGRVDDKSRIPSGQWEQNAND